MSTQHRPYQGYPYQNPPVTDAPSIDAATARRWADLPRRPLQTRHVVYVDIPEDGGSQVANKTPPPRQNKKDNIDDNPVIYIDVPESSGSDVAEPAEPAAAPEYVTDTIFYNPFDNRRIDQGKNEGASGSGSGDRRPPPSRPPPPSTTDLTSPGSSGYGSLTPGLPASMAKEAYVYQATPDDGFLLPSISVSEFPEPPPAYTEIEAPVTPVRPTGPTDSPGSEAEPPRTIVITPGSRNPQTADEPSPIGLPDPRRKVVYCHYCGLRVHTLVIRQTGTATHVVALSFLCIGLFPMTILVYLTDICKNKNHYCPNCNKLIGYEVPILCKDMAYTK